MPDFDVDSLDLTPYLTAPLLPTEATVTLADDLLAALPPDIASYVKIAAKRLEEGVTETKAALIARVDLAGAEGGVEVAFDFAVDRFWYCLSARFEEAKAYGLPGLNYLTDEQKVQIDLDEKREQAEAARELENHLFGDGRTWLQKPYAQQVVHMSSRLSFIASHEKQAIYAEVIGESLLATLQVLQERYKSMVHERAMRNDTAADLRVLRVALQRLISRYNGAVMTALLTEPTAESVELMQTILRPMITSRVRRTRPNGTASESDIDPGSEPDALDPNAHFDAQLEPQLEKAALEAEPVTP